MSGIAIIGGTGLDALAGLEIEGEERVSTPWGEPSAPISRGRLGGKPVVFLPRHGSGHSIPPHRINYRANIRALADEGVDRVIAVAAVGGIHASFKPASLAVPDQIIDYTWSRGHTFFDDSQGEVVHVDFTHPYDRALRELLVRAARASGVEVVEWGTYGATQGPRLETAAEIDRMERDGCHLVGMTGMPEAALAREAGLAYAHLVVVANAAAGRAGEIITMEDIVANVTDGMRAARRLLERAVALA